MTKIILELDTDSMTLAEIFIAAKKFMNAYADRASDITQSLSVIDKEISKEMHIVETSSLNVVDGYKSYARLRELRRSRRVVKNDMGFDQAVKECGLKVDMMRSHMNKLNNNHKIKESYRQSQVEYLNMDVLGNICWTDVENTVNSCLPGVDEQKENLSNKVLAMNA